MDFPLFQWQIWALILWLAPLAGFVLQIMIGQYLPRKGDWLPISGIATSFLITVLFLTRMLSREGGFGTGPDQSLTYAITWIDANLVAQITGLENLPIEMGFLIDNVTVVMLFVVTLVSLLVHIYSIGYMEGDDKYARFFSFLNLFSFAMLGLVLVDNIFGLYIFWELVGLASYLLIGFWYEKENMRPARACVKAFLTTRVGDIGMFIGLLLVVFHVGELNYHAIFESVATGGAAAFSGFTLPIIRMNISAEGAWTLAGVLLFAGSIGKSAQFPLHVWLPDAMEGPTPVSALIHAATMVAAGVYLVARLFPFFTPEALVFIAVIGGFTSFFAASMAMVADDIKQVLAYSTISQLGYMVLALGVGGWLAGFFHLYTHAFFKALLFLCAGSVIHAVHTNDMWDMGGLWKKMPWTFATMLLATLSISGLPLFSGFISKDLILKYTLYSGLLGSAGDLLGGVGTVIDVALPILGFGVAFMTAFYMFRLIYLTFSGEPRDQEKYEHAHESPFTMVIPMAILGLMSFWFVLGPNPVDTQNTWFQTYLEKPERSDYLPPSHATQTDRDGSEWAEKSREARNPFSGKALQTSMVTVQNHRPADAAPFPVSMALQEEHAGENGEGESHGSEEDSGAHHGEEYETAEHWAFLLSILIVPIGIGTSTIIYFEPYRLVKPAWFSSKLGIVYRVLNNQYYFDELYYYGFVLPSIRFSRFLAGILDIGFLDALVDDTARMTRGSADVTGWVDDYVVDGFVEGTGETVGDMGQAARSPQTGNIRSYLGFIGIGVLLLVVVSLAGIHWVEGIPGWEQAARWVYAQLGPMGLITVVVATLGILLGVTSRFAGRIYQWFRIGSVRE